MRRLVSALVAAGTVFSAAALLAAPAAADTQFFDVSSRKWVSIKPTRIEMSKAAREKFRRRIVDVETAQKPGTIIINTDARFLYYVLPDGKAVRYGIGVGREGFTWSGSEKITRKAEWPGWTPPPEMLARQPKLPRYMPGGPRNPLGARALYLGNTLYRIHGTNEDWTIGQAVSSGCIRMMNEDVIDLYDRAKIGTKVVVVGPSKPMPTAFMEGVGDGVAQLADGVGRGLSTLIPQ
jgi:lipoprotein-anchoring transpeptidase ErfK/SrfK